MMEVERATAGRLLDRLEDNGLVRREADPEDRRVRRVFPTERATQEQQRMRRVADAIVDEALADLAPAERDALIGLMSAVRAQLSRLTQASSPAALAAAAE